MKDKIIDWFLTTYVKHRFLWNFYRRRNENKILQDYITQRIIGYKDEKPQENRRGELLEKQGEEKELALFISFLRNYK